QDIVVDMWASHFTSWRNRSTQRVLADFQRRCLTSEPLRQKYLRRLEAKRMGMEDRKLAPQVTDAEKRAKVLRKLQGLLSKWQQRLKAAPRNVEKRLRARIAELQRLRRQKEDEMSHKDGSEEQKTKQHARDCKLHELQRQRLHRTFDGWRERLKLRRLVAGMWLERRKSWSGALFSAWGTFAQKASSQRQHLRAFKLRVKFRKASRAAKQQRVRSDASWLRRFFRAYALWVQRARRLQARARPLALALQNARKARRLGAWAVHGRALHVSSQRAVRAFRAWLEEARRNKALSWASRSLVSDRVLRAWKEGFQGLHSWFLSRRTLRAMIGGRRTTLLSSVLYCWVAALLPGRHA
ncbi:unnamed protein product, partial [Effrenium voratum]